MMEKFRIGYFADGPWGHLTLDKLLQDVSLEIAFIVPRNDTKDSYLKSKANDYGIDYLVPVKVNSEEFYQRAEAYHCDLFVSMSYNQIFRERIYNLPKYKTINCHAGKLPFYRGRNILNWALINDEKEFKNNSSDKCVGNENITKEEYNQYVENITPSFSLWKNMLKAFITGGLICLMGQVWIELFKYFGMDKEQAVNWTTVVLIAESVILTGLNIYPKIGKFGGAGALVPITGFANGVASSATEFGAEGQVFGIGCKIFTIAGPVILYGIFSSWVLGIIYWIINLVW